MEDEAIIGLYLSRSEQAIAETQSKYGRMCTGISMKILKNRQDAEECVNDTWLWTWDHIPPEHPISLRTFLGNIIRRVSITRYRYQHAAQRNRKLEVALSELEECLPDPEPVADGGEPLGKLVGQFLQTQKDSDRCIFLMRYYDVMTVKDIASELGLAENAVSKRLQVMRERLRTYLEERGYAV